MKTDTEFSAILADMLVSGREYHFDITVPSSKFKGMISGVVREVDDYPFPHAIIVRTDESSHKGQVEAVCFEHVTRVLGEFRKL